MRNRRDAYSAFLFLRNRKRGFLLSRGATPRLFPLSRVSRAHHSLSVFRDFLFPPITRVVKKPSPDKKVAGGVNDRQREIVEFTNENVTRRVHTFTRPSPAHPV